MATRAGVPEYSTSPRAQRRSERSIRASWATGYWGATSSIRASISTRLRTTHETIVRARSPAAGSASTSASWRSSTAVAVRCPKSASNTAASATRRPARRLRTRSPPVSEEAFIGKTSARAAGGSPSDPCEGGPHRSRRWQVVPPPSGSPGVPIDEGRPRSQPLPALRSIHGTPGVPAKLVIVNPAPPVAVLRAPRCPRRRPGRSRSGPGARAGARPRGRPPPAPGGRRARGQLRDGR
jgi:hypothetical protein